MTHEAGKMRLLTKRCVNDYLWPAVIAIGEGPLGARGSSHVLISTSTLSRNCTWRKKKYTENNRLRAKRQLSLDLITTSKETVDDVITEKIMTKQDWTNS